MKSVSPFLMVKIVTLHDDVAYGFFFESSRKLLDYLHSRARNLHEITNAYDINSASLENLIEKHLSYGLIETCRGAFRLSERGRLIADNLPPTEEAEIFISRNNKPPKNPLMALIALYYGYEYYPIVSIMTGIKKASVNPALAWLLRKGLVEQEKTGRYYRYFLTPRGKEIAYEIEPRLTEVENSLYARKRRIILRGAEQRLACLKYNHPELFRESHEKEDEIELEQNNRGEPPPEVIERIKEPEILTPHDLYRLAEEFGPEDWN